MSLIPSPVTRREMIKLMAVAGAAATGARSAFGQSKRPDLPSARLITHYLQTLARADGGYAWGDQAITHLTATFGVIGAYRVLQQTLPNKEALVQYVRTHHPRELKK